MMNLIDGGIQHSNIFLHMPLFDSITYKGCVDGKVRKYCAIREDQQCQFLVLNVIRKEEDIIWDAVEDLIGRSVIQVASGVHGVYVFDLLTIDIHKEVKTFNPNELTMVLTNHARKTAPGAVRLIKYSSVYGLLQKTLDESWGKITLKTAVEVFNDKPYFLDLLVKRLIKNFEFSHDPGILLLNDLSQDPIFNPADEQQQSRLKALMKEQIPTTIEFPPEVYIQDKNGLRELLSGSLIWKGEAGA
ncbi:MAG: hypothetical protein Q7S13_05405 [Candidatus Omnitrophota bacterium]|nr:hypothetical protein [Candidatus Omnitrophota bacterium]